MYEPLPPSDQPAHDHEIVRRLIELQRDVSVLREDIRALHAAVADLHRRLRLIAGW